MKALDSLTRYFFYWSTTQDGGRRVTRLEFTDTVVFYNEAHLVGLYDRFPDIRGLARHRAVPLEGTYEKN